MSQCVPSWDLDDDLLHHRRDRHSPHPSSAAVATATAAKYGVMELMWNDVGLGKPILRNLSSIAAVSTAAGGGSDGGGTLECIVDRARSGAHQTASDAMVPCSDAGVQKPARVSGTSCASQGSATPTAAAVGERKSMPTPSLPSAGDEVDEGCGGGGGSPETGNGSFAGGKPLGVDKHDSARSQLDGLEERGITSISAKRSREAAVHSQSERKRRDRINQKMKTLQKLLPNSSKTDKASMLDEVIEYLKLLQAQVQMMYRMSSIPMAMMLPIAMHQQQLQLSMLAQMTQISRMGTSLGMFDPSFLNPSPPPPILHPSTFLPLPPTTSGAWDARTAEWMQLLGHRVLPDMVPAFMGCQAQQQPMSSEAYSRLAALYQQLYQQPLGSNPKTSN